MSDIKHSDRAHSLTGFSGAFRWLYCTAQPALQEDLELQGKIKDISSKPADRGTLCHEVAEEICFGRKSAKSFVGKKHLGDLTFTDEMADATMEAVKIARKLKKDHPKYLWSLEKREGPLDQFPTLWGTCDMQGVIPGDSVIVADYKFGNKIVKAYDNPQLILTGIVVAMTNFIDITQDDVIKGIIIQPNGDNTLVSYKADMVQEYYNLLAKYFDEEEDKVYAPDSNRCHFCACRPHCEAHAESNMKVSFDEVKEVEVVEDKAVGMPALSLPAPANVPEGSVADVMRFKSAFDKWYKDFLTIWQPKAEEGVNIPGAKVVKGKKGTRKWVKPTEEMVATFNMMFLPESEYMETKIVSPTAFEKSNPSLYRALETQGLVKQDEGKPVLALEDDKRKDYNLSALFESVQ